MWSWTTTKFTRPGSSIAGGRPTPRRELVFQPTYCPRSNPLERVYGDTHDQVTRHHRRKRIGHLVQDVARHFREHGPWLYRLNEIGSTPESTAAVEQLRRERARPAA